MPTELCACWCGEQWAQVKVQVQGVVFHPLTYWQASGQWTEEKGSVLKREPPKQPCVSLALGRH